MDLGATICTRTMPDCGSCPLKNLCTAHSEGRVNEFPTKKPRKNLPRKKRIFVILKSLESRLLLIKKPSAGLWGGLWCFPDFENLKSVKTWFTTIGYEEHKKIQQLPLLPHSFSHYQLLINPVIVTCEKPEEIVLSVDHWSWFTGSELQGIALPAPMVKLIKSALDAE